MDLGAPFFCIGIYLYTSYRILEKDSYYYTWRKVFMKEKTPSKAIKNAGSVSSGAISLVVSFTACGRTVYCFFVLPQRNGK